MRMIRLSPIIVAIAVAIVLVATAARADTPIIVVDGAEYQATKVTPSGVWHFETPDVFPRAAATVRHVWQGNGNDHLPCEGGIHWIDNDNLLTISHCLEVEEPPSTTTPPTTTPPPTTTTTSPPPSSTTTTTTPETSTTTSTVPPTTMVTTPVPPSTSVPPTTLPECRHTQNPEGTCEPTPTDPEPIPEPPTELPMTGIPLFPLVGLGFGMIALSAGLLRATSRRRHVDR